MVRLFAIVQFIVACLISGCPPPAGQTPQPPAVRDVLAWIGPNGAVTTRERLPNGAFDIGSTVVHIRDQNITSGPALANDGLTWMLMWNRGGQLEMRQGLGGDASGPIHWEQPVPSTTLRVGALGSPALAYGAGHFVSAFRSPGGVLSSATSSTANYSDWGPAQNGVVSALPMVTADGSALTLAPKDPALAYGVFAGTPEFIVVFVAVTGGGWHAFTSTSTNGSVWSAPSQLLKAGSDPASLALFNESDKDPAIAIKNGLAYVVLSRAVTTACPGDPSTRCGSYQNTVLRTNDGQLWGLIGEYGPTANDPTGPALAWDGCSLLTTEAIGNAVGGPFLGVSLRTATISNPCVGADDVVMSADTPIEVLLANQPEGALVTNFAARTALAHQGPQAGTIANRHVVMLAGGSQGFDFPLATAVELDPYADASTWAKPQMEQAHGLGNVAILLDNGDVLVAGGLDHQFTNVSPLVQTRSAELFSNGAFELTTPMNVAREGATATLLGDGTVLVIGGVNDQPNGRGLSSAEIYDPHAKTWTTVGSLSVPRWGRVTTPASTATLLRSGKVLVEGGCCQGLEVFDPVLRRFSSLNIGQPDMFDAATTLPSGRVLFTGGVRQWAAVFDPQAPSPSQAWLNVPAPTGLAFQRDNYYDASVLLPSGTTLVVIGSRHPVVTQADLFDEQTLSFRSAGVVAQPHASSGAEWFANVEVVAMDDGNAVIFDPVYFTWLYQTATGTFTQLPAPQTGLGFGMTLLDQ